MSPAEQDAQVLYEAIGRAMSNWAFVESGLITVLAYAIGPVSQIYQTNEAGVRSRSGARFHDGEAAEAIFAAVENFRSKLSLIDAALRATPIATSPSLVGCWEKIHARVVKASKHRNRIAHWRVLLSPEGKPDRRARLVPSHFSPAALPYLRDEKTGYFHRDITRISEVFTRTSIMLHEFERAISGMIELHDRYAQHIADQVANYDRCSPSDAARIRRLFEEPASNQPG